MLSSITGQNERWAQLAAYQAPPAAQSSQTASGATSAYASSSLWAADRQGAVTGDTSPPLADGTNFALMAFGSSSQTGGSTLPRFERRLDLVERDVRHVPASDRSAVAAVDVRRDVVVLRQQRHGGQPRPRTPIRRRSATAGPPPARCRRNCSSFPPISAAWPRPWGRVAGRARRSRPVGRRRRPGRRRAAATSSIAGRCRPAAAATSAAAGRRRASNGMGRHSCSSSRPGLTGPATTVPRRHR